MDFERMCEERDAALLSLDEKQIRRYARKYGVPMPTNNLAFWAGIHKARCQLDSMPDDARQASATWLAMHGMSTGLPE